MIAKILSQVAEKLRQYLEVKIRLLKISLISQAATLVGSLIFMFICMFIVFCIMLFTGLGVVEVFSDLGLSRAVSFFVTMGIYLLVLFIALLFRGGITRFFAGFIISGMTGDEDEDKKSKD